MEERESFLKKDRKEREFGSSLFNNKKIDLDVNKFILPKKCY
jgi:hypothetical protein